MALIIIFCAKYLIWGVVAAGVAFLFFSRDWKRLGMFAAVSLAVAYAAGKVAGLLWYNARPFVVDGSVPLIPHAANNGFPSDHTLFAASIASIVFVYNRLLGLLLWALALAVGVGRVLAGVHHFADIAASALIAIVAVAVVEYLLARSAIL